MDLTVEVMKDFLAFMALVVLGCGVATSLLLVARALLEYMTKP